VAKKAPPANKRVTHTFHQGGSTSAKQMDAIFVRNAESDQIMSAKIYRYRDDNGVVKGIPQSYREREMNPSDHFPVVVDMSLNK
jgi:hypothetical protein